VRQEAGADTVDYQPGRRASRGLFELLHISRPDTEKSEPALGTHKDRAAQ